jgi:hypothetical protein
LFRMIKTKLAKERNLVLWAQDYREKK